MILTLVVFGVAVLLWVCTPLDDTFVALAAVAALLLFGVLPASSLVALGSSTTWLLIAAFVLAAGVTASGLPGRLATWLVGRARTVRGLAHLTALALLLTAFFVPSTSGRAALTLPVYSALRSRLNDRVSRALGVLFPSVILLTAVATLVGAGAHLITSALLETATGQGIGFGWWLLLGVPLAVVSAHLTAEIVLWLFTTRTDRTTSLREEVASAGFAGTEFGGAEFGGEQPTAELSVRALVPATVVAAALLPGARDSGARVFGSRVSAARVPAACFSAARSAGPLQGVPWSNSPTRHRQFRTLELLPASTPPLSPATSPHTFTAAMGSTRQQGAGGQPFAAVMGPTRQQRAGGQLSTAAMGSTRQQAAGGQPSTVATASTQPLPTGSPHTRLTRPEWTALAVVLAVSLTWLTEPWHGIAPEAAALAGALLITAPRLGTTTFREAFTSVPWSLLVFMAATTALGTALIKSGVADLIARHIGGHDLQLLATVIAASLLAHLVIQSRSARSSVLIPIVIPLAAAAGMNPVALAFASTAAAGFCHTLTSSAKPVALFADAYRPKDLLKLSAVLAPVTAVLVFGFAVLIWPHLGLPLH